MISVVIPTCNRPRLLEEALNSVLEQSLQPEEIILVNNGDEPLAYFPALSHVRVIEAPRRAGGGQARNIGAATATSEYLAFLDDDDLWEADYLLKASERINASHPDIILARLDYLKNGRVGPGKCAEGLLTKTNLIRYNPGVTGSNIVIKKKIFNELGGFKTYLSVSHDKALILDALLAGRGVLVEPEMQVIYRPQPVSISSGLAAGVLEFFHAYKHLMSPGEKLYVYFRARSLKHRSQGNAPFSHFLWRVVSRLL
jgi:glycosyltransferase involved in cell wall biosynthesis